MPLSNQQITRLEALSGKATLSDSEIAELETLHQGASTSPVASEGKASAQTPWEASLMMDVPESLRDVPSQSRSALGRALMDVAIEGGGGAAGQAVGALPVLSAPTLGLSVPIGGFIGGAGGNALKQLRQRSNGERAGFSTSEALGAGVASMYPGSSLAKAGLKTIAKDAALQGGANLAGMAVESGGVPSLGQSLSALAGGAAGAGLAKGLDTGASSVAAIRKQIDNAVRDETLFAARQAGYKIAPSQLSDAPAVARALEWLAGGPQTVAATEATAREVNLALARKAIGMGENDIVNLPALEAVRKAQGEVYKEVAGVSTRAEVALQKFKEARDRSRAFWQENDRTGTVASGDAAREWTDKMEVYQKVLDKELKDKGRADLIPAFQKARETIAKTHLIEDAFNEGSGSVMGDIIAKRRKAGKTITTDELEVIANFVEATGVAGKTKKVSAVAHPLAAMAATSGALYSGGSAHAMAAGGTAIAAPLLAKHFLMGDFVQNQLMMPSYRAAMPQDLGAAMASLSAMAGGREMGRQDAPRPVPYR